MTALHGCMRWTRKTEQLWRTVKYEEVYLKAYANVLEAQRGLEDYSSGSTTGSGPTSPWATGLQPRSSTGTTVW